MKHMGQNELDLKDVQSSVKWLAHLGVSLQARFNHSSEQLALSLSNSSSYPLRLVNKWVPGKGKLK